MGFAFLIFSAKSGKVKCKWVTLDVMWGRARAFVVLRHSMDAVLKIHVFLCIYICICICMYVCSYMCLTLPTISAQNMRCSDLLAWFSSSTYGILMQQKWNAFAYTGVHVNSNVYSGTRFISNILSSWKSSGMVFSQQEPAKISSFLLRPGRVLTLIRNIHFEISLKQMLIRKLWLWISAETIETMTVAITASKSFEVLFIEKVQHKNCNVLWRVETCNAKSSDCISDMY